MGQRMTAAKKVLVVGTGIAGTSCAYALARRGVNVLAIEAGCGGQATAASAGIIQPWSAAAERSSWYSLYLAGADY